MTLEVMQAVLAENGKEQKLAEDGLGPVALASALSDFYQISSIMENGNGEMDSDQISEFADYGLDLLDRLAYQLRLMEIMHQRDRMACIYASLAVWLVRREAVLDNLEGIADGFAWIVNGLKETSDLGEMCQLMEEVAKAASEKKQMDEDRSNPWRPWRVLNLNAGIAATRSRDPQLMERVFENLGRRLPYDMPGFLADGKRQMMTQNVPEAVREVMNRYAEKWPARPAH
ncbi:MAG: hypothetical protein PVJ14_05700 [Chromatiales bacterium]|jgi:hypothetical protein